MINKELQSSELYNADLAPVPVEQRTWGQWDLAALWVGIAVCIPTYLLASYMIRSGLSWLETLIIIGLANIIVTIPMVLNGHAGVKYGVPFPVLGRTSFGTKGVHVASLLRGFVACGWFGVQTWVGGLAIYAIFNAAAGAEAALGLSVGKFICFGLFWLINMYFVWKGTESIRFLEQFSAPILLCLGIMLVAWGMDRVGNFGKVLAQSEYLAEPAANLVYKNDGTWLELNPLKNQENTLFKAQEVQILTQGKNSFGANNWVAIPANATIKVADSQIESVSLAFRAKIKNKIVQSSTVIAKPIAATPTGLERLWIYIAWLTTMVGFWATMSLSIADVTRYAKSQKDQIVGQFLGLPTTMMLYSFVGIFVTCAAIITFDDVLIGDDAPWDPVSLMAKFDNPIVVIIAQFCMIIATLSTNIAANVIAPANAFSNLSPRKISFKAGGIITGIIGIIICPWLLMDEISTIMLFISGLFGPILGVMLCDYFSIRSTIFNINDCYDTKGKFAYNGNGFNGAAFIALAAGIMVALVGYWIPALSFLYSTSWFTGFFISYVLYYFLMRHEKWQK